MLSNLQTRQDSEDRKDLGMLAMMGAADAVKNLKDNEETDVPRPAAAHSSPKNAGENLRFFKTP